MRYKRTYVLKNGWISASKHSLNTVNFIKISQKNQFEEKFKVQESRNRFEKYEIVKKRTKIIFSINLY